MNKIGVKIDLSTFFEDERKMVFIMVDPNWENVECLQKRVQYLFEVDSVRFLNSEGYFLPPQESIEIIKFCKGLKAFVPKESLEKRKKKKSKKNKSVENSAQEIDSEESNFKILSVKDKLIDDSRKKRKYYSLDSGHTTCFTVNLAKRLKNCNNTHEKHSQSKRVNKTSEITSTIFAKNKRSKADYEEHRLEEVLKDSNFKLNNENTSSTDTEKRHTSTPKKAETPQIDETREEKSSNDESLTILNKSKFREHDKNSKRSEQSLNPFTGHPNKGHIYFDDSGEIVTTTTTKVTSSSTGREHKAIVLFRCPLNDVTNGAQTPRIFHIKPKSIKTESKKQVVEIQEEIILPPVPKLIDIPQSSKENTVTNPNEEQQQNIEMSKNNEEDSAKDTSSLNDTSNVTGSTAIAKSPEHASESKLEVSIKEEMDTPLIKDDASKQTNPNESSIMSVDCVDLSIEIDEEDEVEKKETESEEKKEEEKNSLTKADNHNDSSSDVEEIIDLNETENTTVNKSSLKNYSVNDIKVDKILPFCTNMSNLPNIGDIIVFKIPYINKRQQSVQTSFLAGKAEFINRHTQSIKILIIDGITELCHVPNRFFCNFNKPQDNDKRLQLKLSEMCEAKIFSQI